MKLDEKYFNLRALEMENAALNFPHRIPKMLKQIAEDAFAAGAEAQRNKCFPDCGASNSCPCESATVKWEVPGE